MIPFLLRPLVGFLMLLGCLVSPLAAQVRISEFMSSNGSSLADEDGANEDWIELHNAGTSVADLGGWGLSDDLGAPFKWRFPVGTTVAPGGRLLLWASGKNRIPGSELPGMLREVWNDIPGNNISDLTSHPSYPASPSLRTRLADVIEAPAGIGENYGQRLRGILIPPATGQYRFWISSDDASELRLSTNEDPANLALIARVDGWTNPREWTVSPTQQSALIPLVAGQRYYVDIHMKEGNGGDNLAVRWQLPDGTMEEPLPARHLVSPFPGQLHTNFRLSSDGEPLVLTRADGTVADQAAAVYVPNDVSYGRLEDGSSAWHYFAAPTPGSANTSPPATLPPPVTISEPRGFRDAPFTVALTSAPGATIRYTLDGSTPGPSSPLYTAPITISATTTLRASAAEPGMIELPPTTATWIFLNDVLAQGATPPPGWPADRQVNNHRMEYGLHAEIVTSDRARLLAGLRSIPSISLVTDLDHLFGVGTGLYSYASQSHDWERPVSVELLDPAGDDAAQFQIDAGLRLRGAFSRGEDNPKHSFRLLFSSAYGASSLDFPLFGEEGPSSFEKIDLQTSQNYSWAFLNDPNNTFVREVFSRDTQRDMGMPHTRSRYYHLYLNGQYWGLYMSQERGDADWAATHLGGVAEDWDTIKTTQPGYVTQASDGNFEAFHALHDLAVNQGVEGANAGNYWRARGLNPDGTRNPALPVLLDQDNLIHYMLVAHYTGDPDSPVSIWGGFPNNLYALYNRAAPDGFKWLRHDAEHSLGATGGYVDTTDAGSTFTGQYQFNPAILHWRLAQHPEYRLRVADILQRHLFGEGVLTPAKARARIQARMAQIDTAIIGESARWGRGYTRDATWLPACERVLEYLDQRRDILVAQYRNRGWFPSIDAPAGVIDGVFLRLSARTSYYYMTDGSDPRLTGGGIHPSAVPVTVAASDPAPVALVPRTATWRYYDLGSEPPVLDGVAWYQSAYPAASWSSGPAVLGFAGSSPVNTVATTTRRWVSGDSGPQVNTTYLRHEFTLGAEADFSELRFELLRDDGVVLYLNGVELLRDNMPAGEIGYSTLAASTAGNADQTTWFALPSTAAHLLRPGGNVLAASVHQSTAASSDKYFGLSLAAVPAPETLDLPVRLARSVRARAYQNGEWSALADFSTLSGIPEPVPVHSWNFDTAATYLQPSQTVGGAASLQAVPGASTQVLQNAAGQDFATGHLRVNNPLGSTLTWRLPTTGYGGLTLSWATRRSGQGAGIQTVAYTTDGANWTPLATYEVLDAAPQPKTFDLAGLTAAENNPLFAVRVTFTQGAGGTAGNNRFDDVTLQGILLDTPRPPAALAFDAYPVGTQSGALLAPVIVRVIDQDGLLASTYTGPVTVALSGSGALAGTRTVNAVAGLATFGDLVLTGIGVHQLVASAPELPSATGVAFRSLGLTALLVPQFIQGGTDALGENNERVPFVWRARIDGLAPLATYRFANRVVLPTDTATSDGAGNMIFVTGSAEAWVRSTASPRFLATDLGAGHHAFTADATGTFTGWFITEPSGNARFTPGNTVLPRLLLNNGAAGETTAYVLTAADGAQVLRFGTGSGEGSAVYGQAATPARRLVVLYADTAAATRPLAITPVETTGAVIDARYAAFYRDIVAVRPSHWGALLPNTLPTGLRRIDIRSADTEAALLQTLVADAGFAGTVNPAGGVAAPVALATATPYAVWAGEQGLGAGVNDAPDADPDADGLPNLLEYVLGGVALAPDAGLTPTVGGSGGDLVFTFRRADRSETDTSLVVQHSTGLGVPVSWTDVAVGATGSTAGGVTVAVEENGAAPDTVIVTLPRGSAPTLFVRLRATQL